MVTIPAPHLGLLPKPGVLGGAEGVGLSHEWGEVLQGAWGWPWPLMGAVPQVPRALDIFGNQWTQKKRSPWCWAQPWPETVQRCGWDGAWLSQEGTLCPEWSWCAWRSLGRLSRRVGIEGTLRELTQKSQVKPEALLCSGIWGILLKTVSWEVIEQKCALLLSSPLKHLLVQPRRLFLSIYYFPWLGKQDLLHHLKVTNTPRHCWNSAVKYFLTSTAMQASSSFFLLLWFPVRGQSTAAVQPNTQRFSLSTFENSVQISFHSGASWAEDVFSNTKHTDCILEGSHCKHSMSFSCKLHCYKITNDMEMKTGQTKLQTCIFC